MTALTSTAQSFTGKTAAELREHAEAHPEHVPFVVEYLQSRAKLRKPSAMLLAELTGEDVKPGKKQPRDTTRNPKPEHAAGPQNVIDPKSLERSTLYSAKTGRKLAGFAKTKAWEQAVASLSAKPEPNTVASHKATGGAAPDAKPEAHGKRRTKALLLAEMGEALAVLGREYQALCDEEAAHTQR